MTIKRASNFDNKQNIRLAYSMLETIPYMKPMKPITGEKY